MPILPSAPPKAAVVSKRDEPVAAPRSRVTYRDNAEFRFLLRLRTKKNEPRIVVRCFETEGPDETRQYLTPEVVMGSGSGYKIFQKDFLKVESPEGGWGDQDPESEDAKRAVMQLLATEPGDPGIPAEYFKEFSNMQRAFVSDHAKAIKHLIWQRYES